jgi:hypothetical protein
MSTPDSINLFFNQEPFKTPVERRRAELIELMRRVVKFDDCARALRMSYTHTMIRSTTEKTQARQQLGKIYAQQMDESADIIIAELTRHLTSGRASVNLGEVVGGRPTQDAGETQGDSCTE